MLGASGVGVVTAPEGIEVEAPGAAAGYGLLQWSAFLSVMGNLLQGVASGQPSAVARNGVIIQAATMAVDALGKLAVPVPGADQETIKWLLSEIPDKLNLYASAHCGG